MENKKQVSASPTTGDDSVFVSSTESATVPLKNNASRSSLSDADKVVGSKKPSLKSQSSIGSYTETSSKTLVNEDSVEIKIQSESFQAPSSFLSQQVCYKFEIFLETLEFVLKLKEARSFVT